MKFEFRKLSFDLLRMVNQSNPFRVSGFDIRILGKFLQRIIFPFKNLSKRNQRIVAGISILVILIVIPLVIYTLIHAGISKAAWPPARRASGSESLIPLGLLLANIVKRKFYVYLLQSLRDKNFYIGQTDNIERRFHEHTSGISKSTKSRAPFKLIGFEEFSSQSEARWREHVLKNHSDKKKKFIEDLVKQKV